VLYIPTVAYILGVLPNVEFSNWVEQRGSADVADNVRGALDTIAKTKSS
jgi:hypothetical protein